MITKLTKQPRYESKRQLSRVCTEYRRFTFYNHPEDSSHTLFHSVLSGLHPNSQRYSTRVPCVSSLDGYLTLSPEPLGILGPLLVSASHKLNTIRNEKTNNHMSTLLKVQVPYRTVFHYILVVYNDMSGAFEVL